MKKLYITKAVVIISLIVVPLYLTYSHPQSNKYCFMWQCYVYSDSEPVKGNMVYPVGTFSSEGGIPELFKPTPGYTGLWRIWSKEGHLLSVAEAVDGKLKGCAIKYWKGSDQVFAESWYGHNNSLETYVPPNVCVPGDFYSDIRMVRGYHRDGRISNFGSFYANWGVKEIIIDANKQMDNRYTNYSYRAMVKKLDGKLAEFRKKVEE